MASQSRWTEEKIGRIAVKADQAATKKDWSRAIRYGEKMLSASAELYLFSDIGYINRLKTLNRYYDKAGRLQEVPHRIETAYTLSKKHLGPKHHAAKVSHLLYYKLVVANKNYMKAIELVQENIAGLETDKDDGFRLLHYLKQLYSLYNLTEQLEQEEQILQKVLTLNTQLMGNALEDNRTIIISLAKNYCRQQKLAAFNALMEKYDLKYEC